MMIESLVFVEQLRNYKLPNEVYDGLKDILLCSKTKCINGL